MRKNIVLALLILLCHILQASVLPWIAFGGIAPNLLMIFVASCGFMNGEKAGMTIGFICGLLVDIFTGDIIGFYALLYTLTGYINGTFQRMFYPEDIKLPLFLILLSDLGYGCCCYVFLFLFRNRLDVGYYFLHVILPEAVYTIVVAFGVYPLLLSIHNRLEDAERRRAEEREKRKKKE